ncbi:MAG: histone deacetylase [Ignavibacteria bacterium]
MKVFYSDKYIFPLPDHHRFPLEKYRLLREQLISENILSEVELIESKPAEKEQILLAHTPEYYTSFEKGTIDKSMIRMLGFPWSYELHLRSLASVGGAIRSAEEAMLNGVAGNLAGGTHHAFADHSEGYCVYNDFAVVSKFLLTNDSGKRIVIIDLDVHQGNGTAAILAGNENVFILDMFGKKNYPFKKISATIDVALDDGMEDDEYLEKLKINLAKIFRHDPSIVLYLAGVDGLKEDTLGRLSLTKEGLLERDRIIFSECRKKNISVSIGLGGGYSKPISHTVDAYCGTYKAAKEILA